MRTHWRIVGIAAVVAILGMTALVGVATAQEPSEGWPGWLADLPQQMKEAVADALGISVDEYDAAVETARKQVLGQAVAEGHLTQEQADRIQERMELGFGPGMMRRGAFGPRAGWGGPEDSMVTVMADELGMTVDELMAELRDGKSVADVASDRGVDPQAIADAIVAKVAERLSQAVADGRITQEQADQMLSRMEERVQEHLDSTLPFGGHGPGGFWGGGRGLFRGFCGQGGF